MRTRAQEKISPQKTAPSSFPRSTKPAAGPQLHRKAIPSSVEDVLRSTGQPLGPEIRAQVEPRFGHDFSRVRVHTDAIGAESARSVNADAYTVGPHIVFGAGQFTPATPPGRLLSHELAHVVQQARSPVPAAGGVSRVDDFHERQAGAVADAFTQGGDIAGLLGSDSGLAFSGLQRQVAHATPPNAAPPATAAPPAPRPLDYDRDPVALSLVLKGQTAENVRKFLGDKIANGEITSFAVAGVTKGSNAEIFLLDALDRLAKKSRWGTELDIVTAIDWPATPGGAPPQGRVTVRIDQGGAASAELIAAGPVPAVAQTTAAAGSARLISDFGFASVTGWSGRNAARDAAEISDVLAALTLLKTRAPQDIPALKGVELIRVATLAGNTAGEFSTGGGAAAGGGAPTRPSLKLADRAFANDDTQFVGGGQDSPTVPSSFQIILHEVGHGVEKEEIRKALEEVNAASAEVETARQRLANEGATFEAEQKEAKQKGRLTQFYKARADAHKKNEEAEAKASSNLQAKQHKVQDTQVPASVVQPFETEAAALKAAADTSLNNAQAGVQAMSANEVQSSANFVQSLQAMAAAITTFASNAKAGTASVDDLELIVYQKAFDRDKAGFELMKLRPGDKHTNRAVILFSPVGNAQDVWFEAERAVARARLRTRRLQKFVDLVVANHIRRFTQYSVSNWTLKPEEFYAEAYSLWLTDPAFLKTNYPVVFNYFQNGDYRK